MRFRRQDWGCAPRLKLGFRFRIEAGARLQEELQVAGAGTFRVS